MSRWRFLGRSAPVRRGAVLIAMVALLASVSAAAPTRPRTRVTVERLRVVGETIGAPVSDGHRFLAYATDRSANGYGGQRIVVVDERGVESKTSASPDPDGCDATGVGFGRVVLDCAGGPWLLNIRSGRSTRLAVPASSGAWGPIGRYWIQGEDCSYGGPTDGSCPPAFLNWHTGEHRSAGLLPDANLDDPRLRQDYTATHATITVVGNPTRATASRLVLHVPRKHPVQIARLDRYPVAAQISGDAVLWVENARVHGYLINTRRYVALPGVTAASVLGPGGVDLRATSHHAYLALATAAPGVWTLYRAAFPVNG